MKKKELNLYIPEGGAKSQPKKYIRAHASWSWLAEAQFSYFLILLFVFLISALLILSVSLYPVSYKSELRSEQLEMLSEDLMSKEYLLTLSPHFVSLSFFILVFFVVLTVTILLFWYKNYVFFVSLLLTLLLFGAIFSAPSQMDKGAINNSVKNLYSSSFYNDTRLAVGGNELKLLLEVEELEDRKVKIKTTFADKDEAEYYEAYKEYEKLKPTLESPFVKLPAKETPND